MPTERRGSQPKPDITFDVACELIGQTLKARPEIVKGILESKSSAKPLPRLRYFMRSHVFEAGGSKIHLERVIKKLDNRARDEGFNALHDWDGAVDKFNKEIIPVDVLNYLMQIQYPGDSERNVLAILLDYYFLYVLGLLSLRVWDDGKGDDHVERVNQLLGDLQGSNGSGQQFVENPATLVLLATSHFEGEDEAYDRLFQRIKTLNQSHRTETALVYAGVLGSHLRFGLQVAYARDIGKMREDNVPDYPLLCFALTTLMDAYARLGDEGVQGPARSRIAEGILNGLSPDAAAFLRDPPPALAACEDQRAGFFEGLRRHKQELLEEFERVRPGDQTYSPISFFFNFPHNLIKGAVVDAVLRGKPWGVTLNDLLTGSPPGEPAEESQETQETLAKTLMGYARANPDPYRGHLVPSIVYDPRAGRRACANAIEEIEKV